jgi:DNA-binding NarL/FixJ family response regulator
MDVASIQRSNDRLRGNAAWQARPGDCGPTGARTEEVSPLLGESTGHLTLDSRERTLILLLAAGHTDASAARRLRVSPRTVTNILRNLMDRLCVDNRFQLGVALGARMRGGVGTVGPAARRQVEPGPTVPLRLHNRADGSVA